MISKRVGWVKVPVVLSTVCLAAACSSGGGGQTSSSSSPTSDQGTSASASTTPSSTGSSDASADKATANAINLTQADLSGWTSSAADQSNNNPLGAQLAKCAGAPDPATIDVVDVSSPNFDQGNAEINSDVTMVKTPADAQADLQAFQSDKMSSCLQSVAGPFIQQSLPSGSTVGTITFNRLTAPAGIPDSFAFQAVIPVTVPGQGSTTITSDMVGVLVGRAEIELDNTTTSGTPDQSIESRLIGVLYNRAKSQPGTA